MRPVAISLSPNTDRDDVQLAADVLRRKDTWGDLDIIQQTSAAVGRILQGSFVALTSSGRSALELLLKAHDIKRGDEVIVQAFTCIAVPQPILWRHATPVYADILPATYTLDPEDVKRKITARTKAIIIQHTFGIPGPLQEILAVAKEKNILVIEDCAHALGSSLEEKMLGTWADAAIFSFGRDKSFSSVFGGAIATKNQELLMQVQRHMQSLVPAPASWVTQQLRHPILFSLALSTYTTLNIGKAIIAVSRDLGLTSRAVAPSERLGHRPNHTNYTYAPALAYLLHNQLEKFHDYTTRRQSLGQRYFSGLPQFKESLPSVSTAAKVAWLRFPLLVKEPLELIQTAAKQGMMLGDWYDAPLAPSDAPLDTFLYTKGSCPVAEEVSQHVINFPTYPLMTDQQIDDVIAFATAHASPYHL